MRRLGSARAASIGSHQVVDAQLRRLAHGVIHNRLLVAGPGAVLRVLLLDAEDVTAFTAFEV